MTGISALLAVMALATQATPGQKLQTDGGNSVVRHDPSGARIDIVAEDPGSCSGPGPTAIMRLRSADPDRTIVAKVARSTNVRGTITVTQASYSVAPMAAVDLGCLSQPAPDGGRPLSTSEWKIIASSAE